MEKKVQCNISHPFEENTERKAVRSGPEVYALCNEKWILELEDISQDLHTQGSDYAEVRYQHKGGMKKSGKIPTDEDVIIEQARKRATRT
jgi:hypothetical protein